MSLPSRAFCLKCVYICIYFIVYISSCFFVFFLSVIVTLTLVGTFIDAKWRQNPRPRPPLCVRPHFQSELLCPERHDAAGWVLGWFQEITVIFCFPSTLTGAPRGHDGGSDLAPLEGQLRRGPKKKKKRKGGWGLMLLFTKTQLLASQCCPKYTRTHTHTNTHTPKSPSVTVQPV